MKRARNTTDADSESKDSARHKEDDTVKAVKHTDHDDQEGGGEESDDSSRFTQTAKKDDEKEIISKIEWDSYTAKMFPAKPLKGKLLKILKSLICDYFSFDPTKADENGDYESNGDMEDDVSYDNFQKFCKMCADEDANDAGLAWLNALHQFESPDMDQPRCDDSSHSEDGETYNIRMEDEKNFGGKFTPLSYVINRDPDDFRTVDMLLGFGADPNLRDGMGQPPLFQVLEKEGRWKTGHALIEAGANTMAYYGGKSIIGWAKLWAKDFEVARMLYDDMKKKVGMHMFADSGDEGSEGGDY